jgi:hypothetical protein
VLAVISISIVPYAFSDVSRPVATVTLLGFVGGYLQADLWSGNRSIHSQPWS